MEFLFAIILGIVQGLTEFLPVSSSGHLSIVNQILEIFGKTPYDPDSGEHLLMTVVLHGATAFATIYIFRKDISEIFNGLLSGVRKEVNFSIKVILSMIPAAFVGIYWDKEIENLFNGNLILVGYMLIITALLLYLADRAKSTKKNVGFVGSVIIGVSQAVAILPGVSRSGATISTSVLLGVDKEKSARFSFLMVVPLILGKMAKDIISGEIQFSSTESLPLLFGFISAFIVGVFACKWMIKIVKNSQLKYFAFYCVIVGVTLITYQYVNS
ncbi:MAG: undecaprenyl-diphosphate phosphatase [Flavobacteriales bacterium]|jgi:undecaprenyl-diphosphatase|nr:undecaprenyl-diphosphate phosphatase [Flavobacteriales bacterium]